ncbi:MAG TPA: hypothetical protein VNX26_14465 [Candidatus Acidoferrum sp.]|jgi:hypothetical protein|nr:hypothetical protein [Candidatus Acidoferrum sp.]
MFRTERVFLAVLFLGLFAMAARNVTDPDVWWHLKTGQYITGHKSVPHMDPFSYTRSGQPWVAHEWLTDVLLYQLERTTGWGGLIVVFAAILCATFFFLYLRCGPRPYVAGVLTLSAACATLPVWGVRPQVLSLLLTSLWLLILDRSECHARLLWWTLPLTLLWVNLHAEFALGLALSALFLTGEWIESALERSKQRAQRLRTATLILLLDLAIVPLNPNGLRMFSYPIETLRSAAMQHYIAEWASPNFHHGEYWPFLLLVLITFAVLSWSRLQVSWRDLLLLVVSLYAGLCSIRMMPLFVLIAVPLISRRLGDRPMKRSQRLRSEPASGTLLNAVIVLAMAVFAGVQISQVIQRQTQAETHLFPASAVAYLQTHSPSGRIFNHYDWGGYLIWRLYPSTPVFIDGRADLYGQPLLDQFAETYQFRGAWQQTLRSWNVDTVLVPADSALATGLRSCPGWTVSYEDAQAIVLTAPRHAIRAKAACLLPLAPKKVHLREQFAGYYE